MRLAQDDDEEEGVRKVVQLVAGRSTRDEPPSSLSSAPQHEAATDRLAMTKLELKPRQLVAALLALASLLQLATLHCLGSEDLNSSNKQHPSIRSIQSSTFKHSFQRPILSNRFSSSLHGGQHLAVQASSSASIFSEPPQQLQHSHLAAPVVAAPAAPQASVSSIEQMMKNALARTVHLNSAASEPRNAELAGPVARTGLESPQLGPKASAAQQQQATTESETVTEVRPTKAIDDEASKVADESQANLNASGGGHETVYSEQRFANLFARRSNLKKSRLQPTEQVKARPTLPSFIKSPPDPKQFASAQTAQSERPLASSSSSFVQSRAQQQLQSSAKINLANQAKKASVTSNSAAIASNKRASSLAQASSGNKSTLGPKTAAPNVNKATLGAAINKSSSSSASSNPFNRSPSQPSSDPANVIALARKRLLANNALESAKLKQQQQQQKQPSSS